MADIEITPEAAEGYLAAVADHLAQKGHQLPDRPYVFDPDEYLGGVIDLPGALPYNDLRLIWDERTGWHAGYPREGVGASALTALLLDVAPPPWIVERAVGRIVRQGRLEAGWPSEDFGPVVHGPEELAAYEPGVHDMVVAGAQALTVRATRLAGNRPVEPGRPATWQVDHARPVVAAVWALLRNRLASAEGGERSADREVDRLRAQSAVRRDLLHETRAKLERAQQAGRAVQDQLDKALTERNDARAELALVLKNYGVLQGEALTLEGERDDARRHRDQAKAERDEARAEAARHLKHLRQAHPLHFTPNVLGERLCGCGGQWPCRTPTEHAKNTQAALDLANVMRRRNVEIFRDLAKSWTKRGYGALAGELLTAFELDESGEEAPDAG